MTPAVAAESLVKRYGDATALGGVSLSVEAGEVFGLVGPNGAGKTTLVRCLTGTATPDDGTAALFGDPPAEADPARLGLLPQEFAPPARLTARELVAYFAGLYDDAMAPDDALDAVGLDPADETRYENLSGGQKRRACVATALVNGPDALFLDEPTTGIDPAGRRSLWRLVEDLADRGTAVVLTTHDMAEAERLADRVGLLADGRLVAAGPPADLIAEHGGESRLVVGTDANPAALDDLDGLVASPSRLRATDEGLAIDGVRPEDIGDVVRALDDRGVAFDRLAWTEPDLEDVYLRLAGDEERERLPSDRPGDRSVPGAPGGEQA